MKLHEYQAKALLRQVGLPVPKSKVVERVEETIPALESMGLRKGVAKAQAFTGGRGKAGGIKLFHNPEEAHDIVGHMIGMKLVTKQTGLFGVPIHSVLLEEASEIERELYVAITLDRAKARPVIMISPEGGMEIEEVAETAPERILKLHPPYGSVLTKEMTDRASSFLGLVGGQVAEFADLLQKLFEVYQKRDATLLEINPLIVDTQGRLSILDCKFSIDDNALFRQQDSGGDPDAERTAAEIDASKHNLSYISLDGNIGCMVNGAGLAMATMDTIAHFGGRPANFLDVGGSASEEAVTYAFEIITRDEAVEAILVNIFGGIMKCDTIGRGIVGAVKSTHLKVPLVVRLEGTNVEEGKKVIRESGLNIISADDLADAARKAVAAVKGEN